MNYIDFIKHFGRHQVIDMSNVETFFNGLDRRRLYEWQKRGLLKKVVSNFYIPSDLVIDEGVLRAAASRIYPPAYVALESALSYYRFIPEAVFRTICITTRRNKLIQTCVGDFQYRSVKPGLFFGSSLVESGHGSFFISDPEKTLLDHFYFTPGADNADVLSEMRLNIDEIRARVNTKKLKGYLGLFASPKVTKAVRYVMEMAHVEF